jgi:glycosyltransferase involved in cell wall biosynthesis
MKISVVIPTFNEDKVLEDCIGSLSNQTGADFEIILVDDGSIDNTKGIVKDLTHRISNLRFYEQSHLGAGAARNFGAKQASGEILVFVDADMTFDKDFLTNLIKPIEINPTSPRLRGARGTFSRDEYVSNWDNTLARCWNINEGWESKKRHPKDYPNHQPVFRAILKSEFDKVGGFTPGGYDDDWSLFKKLGYEAVEAPNTIFYHKNPSSISEIFNHAKWVGKRKYKLGIFGDIVAIVRASLPISLVVGLWKSVVNGMPSFLVFKIIYDFGIFCGILEFLVSGKSSK